MSARREGFALLLCILLVVAMSVLSAGMLLVAQRETRIAAGVAGLMAARAAAEGAARRSVAAWPDTVAARLPVGGVWRIPSDAGPTVAIERLTPRLYLVRSEAVHERGRGGAVRARVGLLVRTFDAGAGLSTGAVVIAGRAEVSGGRVSGLDACGGEAGAGIVAREVVVAGTAEVSGAPPLDTLLAPAPFAGLDPRMATVLVSASAGTPAPRADGDLCLPGGWNWGSLRPSHACAAHVPLVHAPGDLTVRGGEGQGVLTVAGDLTLTGGFVFHGLLRVAGVLRVHDATVRGAVHAGALEMAGGDLGYSSCAVAGALTSPALVRAFRPGDRWWVPLF